MNVFKVADGVVDTGAGVMDVLVEAAPAIADLKQHKATLDAEGASSGKKALFLAGFAFMHFMERWPSIRPGVMEIKDGVQEVIAGYKESGLSPDDLRKLKDAHDKKKHDRCEALPPRKDTPEPAPKKPELPEPVKVPEEEPNKEPDDTGKDDQ